ncbi:hypothetical protein FGO68_gene4987 [Halteria grandinella]|uniref:Uncharacterized protein n=1 Tax=Halteria grandinella TaxID=5974 RepID=A0A8J8NUX0_HALGN|nr:hypothetical protein FGO68_gene4987 [Halteria grandinella]
MRNLRPLAVGVLCCLLSILQAQPISDSMQPERTLETPPPCNTNEFLNTLWNDCLPCADSCKNCTMVFFLGFGGKIGENCLECKDDFKLVYWWDIFSFSQTNYCQPKCTAPAVWDSNENVQDCQTLTLVPSTSTVYQCQPLEITSQLTYLNTQVSNAVWTSSLGSLYPGGYIGYPSADADGPRQILDTEYYKGLSPVIFKWKINKRFNLCHLRSNQSQGLRFKTLQSHQLEDQRLLRRRATCTLYGVGYENGLKLPGPCFIEAKGTKLPKSGSPWITSEWHFKTYNQEIDPVWCDFIPDYIEVTSTASPLVIDAPMFTGPRIDAYFESSFSKTKTPYDVSSGAKLSIPIPGSVKTLELGKNYTVKMCINSPRASYADYYYECEADILFKKK